MTAVFSEVAPLVRVLMRHPRDAFVDQATIASSWKGLNYTAPPDLSRAADEFDRLAAIVRRCSAELLLLPPDSRTSLDSLYVRDASIVSPRGMILCRMGKRERDGEPTVQEAFFRETGIPVAGRIEPPGTLEGGDLVWLDEGTVAVGHGYRTNAHGIAQLRALLGSAVEVIEVGLPHWRGQGDVMHLMSLVSPVDENLVVVYSPLLPVPFRARLLERARLVEVADDEFETMGTNVLALGPRRAVMLDGNPRTRGALEAAGCAVEVYQGDEISVKGAGGPTCLTRPLARAAAASFATAPRR